MTNLLVRDQQVFLFTNAPLPIQFFLVSLHLI